MGEREYPRRTPQAAPTNAGLDAAGLDAAGLDAARFGTARFGAARFGAARFGAARFGAAGLGVAGLIVVPLVLVALAACSGEGPRRSAGPTPSRSPSPAASADMQDSPHPSGTATGGDSAGPGGATKPGDDGSRCRSESLKVEVEEGDSSAGQLGLNLVFTNTASHPCTMRGYPGVSFVIGDAGQQVNDPAQRAAGFDIAAVTLAAGAHAHTPIRMARTGHYADAVCQPVQIAGFRIYPPDDTASLFAASAQQVCSANGVGVAQVYPVRPGRSG